MASSTGSGVAEVLGEADATTRSRALGMGVPFFEIASALLSAAAMTGLSGVDRIGGPRARRQISNRSEVQHANEKRALGQGGGGCGGYHGSRRRRMQDVERWWIHVARGGPDLEPEHGPRGPGCAG